jgi:hypothetical protein
MHQADERIEIVVQRKMMPRIDQHVLQKFVERSDDFLGPIQSFVHFRRIHIEHLRVSKQPIRIYLWTFDAENNWPIL